MEEIVAKKRMLSGIKPSGDMTLGSYLGAVKNWAERADQYDCYYFCRKRSDELFICLRSNYGNEYWHNCYGTACFYFFRFAI